MKKIFTLTTLLFLLISAGFSQAPGYYFKVGLLDKQYSEFSISKPGEFLSQRAIERRLAQQIPVDESDLPVSPSYLKQIREAGAEVIYTSKWLNLVIIRVEQPEIAWRLARKNFISYMISADNLFEQKTRSEKKDFFDNEIITELPGNSLKNQKSHASYNYGASLGQAQMINIPQMHELDFTGKGMTIGVIDAGYNSVDVLPAFASLFANGQILGTRDFVNPGNNVYNSTISTHGTSVLSTMGGNLPGQLIGTAPDADYWLLRSEDAPSEYLMEEYYWVNAAEFADSVGVDIINTSLGYSTFDDPSENHTYADMDGNTTVITIAADKAAAKGILVVVSAGNSGGGAWRYITAPADGDSVLTVGAVDPNGNYVYFSSVGPTADGRTKPDVSAQGMSTIVASVGGGVAGGSGTSFSAPIIAGAAACLWQANPSFTNMELINAIRMSASMATNPDNLMGWGIPDFIKANSILTSAEITEQEIFQSINAFPNPFSSQIGIDLKVTKSMNLDIKLINSTGRVVKSLPGVEVTKGDNNTVLRNLDQLPAGIYMLQITDGHSVITKKLIK